MSQQTSRTRRTLVLSLAAVWSLVPALLAVARWPTWWAWIAPEQTPMTWLQSVALVLAAAGSLLVAFVRQRTARTDTRIWTVLAAGFTALALDERFAVHERVRDGVLAPRGVRIPLLSWIAPGDFLLLAIGVLGLALLPSIWRALEDDRGAKNALVAGVTLAVVAVGLDSIDPSTWTIAAERIEQSAEEVVELASGLAFVATVWLRLFSVLDAAMRGAGLERDPNAAAGRGDLHPAGAGQTSVTLADGIRRRNREATRNA